MKHMAFNFVWKNIRIVILIHLILDCHGGETLLSGQLPATPQFPSSSTLTGSARRSRLSLKRNPYFFGKSQDEPFVWIPVEITPLQEMDSAPQFTETASSPTLLTDGVKRRLFSVAGPSSVPPSTPLLPVTVSRSSLSTNTFHSSSAKKHVPAPSNIPLSTPILPVTVGRRSLFTDVFHSSSAKKHVPAPSNIPLSTPILSVTVGRRSLFTDTFHSSSANKHDVVPASIPPSTPILSVMINRRSQSSSNPGRQSSNPGSQSRSTSTIPPTTSFQLPPPHIRRNPDAKNASSAINKEKGNVFIILCFIYHFQLNRTS